MKLTPSHELHAQAHHVFIQEIHLELKYSCASYVCYRIKPNGLLEPLSQELLRQIREAEAKSRAVSRVRMCTMAVCARAVAYAAVSLPSAAMDCRDKVWPNSNPGPDRMR